MYDKLEKILNSPKFKLILVILFFLPGAPKDSLIMVCALSNITIGHFIIFSMIGRIPASVAFSFMGANLQQRVYCRSNNYWCNSLNSLCFRGYIQKRCI